MVKVAKELIGKKETACFGQSWAELLCTVETSEVNWPSLSPINHTFPKNFGCKKQGHGLELETNCYCVNRFEQPNQTKPNQTKPKQSTADQTKLENDLYTVYNMIRAKLIKLKLPCHATYK